MAKKKGKKKAAKKKKAKKAPRQSSFDKEQEAYYARIRAERAKVGSRLPIYAYKNVYQDCSPERFIVFNEKHGDRYFRAGTPEETLGSFLQILTERFGPDGDWGSVDDQIADMDTVNSWDPAKPEYDAEGIDDLPESLREAARENLGKYNQWEESEKKELEMLTLIKKAIDEQDGEAAYLAMHLRRDYEYERWDFEEVQVPKPWTPKKEKSNA